MSLEKMLATYEFEQWLYGEAKFLDDIDFDGWFNLFASGHFLSNAGSGQ